MEQPSQKFTYFSYAAEAIGPGGACPPTFWPSWEGKGKVHTGITGTSFSHVEPWPGASGIIDSTHSDDAACYCDSSESFT